MHDIDLCVTLRREAEHAIIGRADRRDQTLSNLLLEHDHKPREVHGRLEEMKQDRRRDVVRQIGDHLARLAAGQELPEKPVQFVIEDIAAEQSHMWHAAELVFEAGHERGVYLDGEHPARMSCEAPRERAQAGADLDHVVFFGERGRIDHDAVDVVVKLQVLSQRLLEADAVGLAHLAQFSGRLFG